MFQCFGIAVFLHIDYYRAMFHKVFILAAGIDEDRIQNSLDLGLEAWFVRIPRRVTCLVPFADLLNHDFRGQCGLPKFESSTRWVRRIGRGLSAILV